MSYTLHTPAGNFRAFKALIAAEYNCIDNVSVPEEFDAGAVKGLSPTGKAPVLQTPKGDVIFESNAICRYLSKIRRDTGLLGNGGLYEETCVDSWMEWNMNSLELPCCVWFYPVAGYMPFHKDAYTKSKGDVAKGLSVLNDHLLDKTYLVGDSITLADICVVSTLLYPFKLVCDKSFLKPYGNVVRWFSTCVNQAEFKAVVGEVVMCKKELTAPGQEGPKEDNKKKNQQGKSKSTGKKEKKEKTADAPPPPKKAEHPYKIMDKEKPTKFSMDAWKKQYSNAATYEAAMNYFWDNFDSDGWALWHQNYNYNEDNKKIFMTCNAVGGFQQRTDEVRKWAFGVMDVLGTEETLLEIKGIWLLRGDSVQHLVNANDDANWYTWTKLAGQDKPLTDDVKKQVAAYWCEEKELEGKPIQDSKVFK